MDNNNSIPYGTISWDNEDVFHIRRQQRESEMIQPPRNVHPTTRNGLRHSLRGPQFPPPQPGTRESVVGLLRNSDLLSNRLQQDQRNLSDVQRGADPVRTNSSSHRSSFQNERFFSLRPLIPSQNSSLNVPSQPSPSNSTYLYNNQNTYVTSMSVNQGVSSLSRCPTSSTSYQSNIENVLGNKSKTVPLELIRGGRGGSHKTRSKRKSTQVAEIDNSGGPPSCKQFLSEEKMAAKMHNLRISNDHGYIGNGMPLFNDWSNPNQSGGSQSYDNHGANEESQEKSVEREEDLPVFILNPHMKDSLTKDDPILPQAIFNQILNKPCLAVVPWKPPDENPVFLALGNKYTNLKKSKDGSKPKISNIVFKNVPTTKQFIDERIQHLTVTGESNTLTFEDEDMEL